MIDRQLRILAPLVACVAIVATTSRGAAAAVAATERLVFTMQAQAVPLTIDGQPPAPDSVPPSPLVREGGVLALRLADQTLRPLPFDLPTYFSVDLATVVQFGELDPEVGGPGSHLVWALDDGTNVPDPAGYDSKTFLEVLGDGSVVVAGNLLAEARTVVRRYLEPVEVAYECRLPAGEIHALTIDEERRLAILLTSREGEPGDWVTVCGLEAGNGPAPLRALGPLAIGQRIEVVAGKPWLFVQALDSYGLVDLQELEWRWRQSGRLRMPATSPLIANPDGSLLFVASLTDERPPRSSQLLGLDGETGAVVGQLLIDVVLERVAISSQDGTTGALQLFSTGRQWLVDWSVQACDDPPCRIALPVTDLWAIPRYPPEAGAIVFWCAASVEPAGITLTRRGMDEPLSAAVTLDLTEGLGECRGELRRGRCVGKGICVQYEDTKVTDGAWEYVLSRSGASSSAKAVLTTEWPLGKADFYALHSYFTLQLYEGGVKSAHRGIDLVPTGADRVVAAVRGGIVSGWTAPTKDDKDGSVSFTVVAGGSQGAEILTVHTYQHVSPVRDRGESVGAGDPIAVILEDFHPGLLDYPRHLHWEAGVNPLLTLPVDRRMDSVPPTVEPPIVQPSLENSAQPSGSSSTVVRGDVNIDVEAYDIHAPMAAPPLYQKVAPYQLGFWIESAAGAAVIGSASSPYLLFRFDDRFMKGTSLKWAAVEESQLSTLGDSRVFVNWRLSTSVDGDGLETSPDQDARWRTDAASGGKGNELGWPGDRAVSPTSALFADGEYRIHVQAMDAAMTSSENRASVVIDNWKPFVSELLVQSSNHVAHRGLWEWNAQKAALEHVAAVRRGLPPNDGEATIQASFSEPMNDVSMELTSANGAHVLDAAATAGATMWTARIPTELVSTPGSYAVVVRGHDLAGQPLIAADESAAIPSSYLRAAAATSVELVEAGSRHRFEVGMVKE